MKISILFEKKPPQWGLRGDPYLWDAMKERLMDVEMPANVDKLKSYLEDSYLYITGCPIDKKEIFVVKEFKHGGMSSGGISPKFWADKAIPLLIENFNNL